MSYTEGADAATEPYRLSRYCSRVAQSSMKRCSRKAAWWVSYFHTPGPAADTACDQHLAASVRFIFRRDGDAATRLGTMPKVFELEG